MFIGHIEMLDFCLANTFDPTRAGTTVTGITVDRFMWRVNSQHDEGGRVEVSNEYPEICRHLFLRNRFTTTRRGVVQITPEMEVISEMVVRGGQEGKEEAYESLSVDASSVHPPKAEWLDVILYSREHLASEGIEIEGDWGVAAVLGVEKPTQTPLKRSTLERNAKGTDAGGNGFDVTAEQYAESDAYWYGQGSTGNWITVK